MTTKEMTERFRDWLFRQSAYNMALSLIAFDKMTIAPEGGNEYRDEREAYLAGELFSIRTEPDMLPILEKLKDDPEADADTRRACGFYYQNVMNERCIPKEEYVSWRGLLNESYNVWLKAKTEDDYALFEPYLKKLIEGSKKIYGYRDSDKSLYDRMLDDYEPGMDQKQYDAFFEQIKEKLLPLIRKVTLAAPVDDHFLYGSYPVEGQKVFMDHLLDYLGYTKDWGYQSETEHPFTDWVCRNDCRTTTKYLDSNPVSAVFSTVHECGHAWYRHNIDQRYDGSALADEVSSGMHESQSRLCENYLGRTRAFWEYNYPYLQKQFPAQLGGVPLDDFVRAVNVSRPSLVRTEADELTYPVHILIRYEIEKGLFDGTISTENLDQTWNRKYKEYLGIEPQGARDGILQDVHWSSASFGYFPTYALGSAIAAQIMKKMRSEIDVDQLLRENRFTEIMAWLREHVQHYGRFYDANDVLIHATGEPFRADFYIDYLTEKYTALYGL